MRAELASLNHCAVPFLSRAAVNLIWYDSTCTYVQKLPYKYKYLITFHDEVC